MRGETDDIPLLQCHLALGVRKRMKCKVLHFAIVDDAEINQAAAFRKSVGNVNAARMLRPSDFSETISTRCLEMRVGPAEREPVNRCDTGRDLDPLALASFFKIDRRPEGRGNDRVFEVLIEVRDVDDDLPVQEALLDTDIVALLFFRCEVWIGCEQTWDHTELFKQTREHDTGSVTSVNRRPGARNLSGTGYAVSGEVSKCIAVIAPHHCPALILSRL